MPSLKALGKQTTAVEKKPDRLTSLPDAILVSILLFLKDRKEIVRTCILSKEWRDLWKQVPISIEFCSFHCSHLQEYVDFLDDMNTELHHWSCSEHIRSLQVSFDYEKWHVKEVNEDVDYWVFLSTTHMNVDELKLELYYSALVPPRYEFPQFAFEESSLRRLALWGCDLNPRNVVQWRSLMSLKIGSLRLTDLVMEKVLSGCPNLETLEIANFEGIHSLKISSVKLKTVILQNGDKGSEDVTELLEIVAPNILHFQVLGRWRNILLLLSNMSSLSDATLDFSTSLARTDTLNKACRYVYGLLDSLAHIENLTLCSCFIEILSLQEMQGWKRPILSHKFVKINTSLVEEDFPGICRLLKNAPKLEKLVIDWENHTPR